MPRAKKTTEDAQLRVPRTLLDLADQLVPAMSADPAEIARGPVSKSSIARVAMVIGLQELAHRYKVKLRMPGEDDDGKREIEVVYER